MATTKVIKLEDTSGVHRPGYDLVGYNNGNPRKPIDHVTWGSTFAIQTSKSIGDLVGTFSISLKDKRTRQRVRRMDVIKIRLRGHYNPNMTPVMFGVVDEVRPGGSADAYAGSEDTVITGRCVGKYLQVTSLFLPVWDPQSALPTALTFGYGDATRKVGGNRPFDIYRYLLRRFTFALAATAPGASGIPNARWWLDAHTRFSRQLGFSIPFLQFDETDMATALKRMEVLGFTETFVDELGRIVYRQPGWNHPVRFQLSTGELMNHAFPETDVDVATYLEVIPAGDPGIDSATAQALRAGRAPVPSAYVNAGSGTSLASNVSAEFVYETDAQGAPTAKGRRNHWYRLQRELGVRPQQITSPLLTTQSQAQAQAEGLLRFFGRTAKTMQVTIPGAPEVTLGENMRVLGALEGIPKDTIYYLEQVSHDYTEDVNGGSYTTGLIGTHGRDRNDPGFPSITLPKFDAAALATQGGTLDDGGIVSGRGGTGSAPVGQRGNVKCDPGNGDFVSQTTRPDGQRVLPIAALSDFLALAAGQTGKTLFTNTYSRHPRLSTSGLQSDHWLGEGCDCHVTVNWPGAYGTELAAIMLALCDDLDAAQAQAIAKGGGSYTRHPWTHDGVKYSVQILWGPAVGHLDHVHCGVRPF